MSDLDQSFGNGASHSAQSGHTNIHHTLLVVLSFVNSRAGYWSRSVFVRLLARSCSIEFRSSRPSWDRSDAYASYWRLIAPFRRRRVLRVPSTIAPLADVP